MNQKFVEVQFYNWEKPRLLNPQQLKLKAGDWVIIDNQSEQEIGKVVDMGEIDSEELEEELITVLRIADLTDLKKLKTQQASREEAIRVCKQYIRKFNLPMKLVDCIFSFDDKKLTFAFTSDTRVDFRELVKELTRTFKKNIRLQQIGIRDELKQSEGIGPCGRRLCCSLFLDDLGNITTDLARLQHVEHRGSERLSGACGRLKCCLNYEAEGYREMSEKLPPLGTPYRSKEHGPCQVIGWHILRHTIDLKTKDGTRVEEFVGDKVKCTGCKACNNCNKKK